MSSKNRKKEKQKPKRSFQNTPPRIARCHGYFIFVAAIIFMILIIRENTFVYGDAVGQGQIDTLDIFFYSVAQISLLTATSTLLFQVPFWITKGICFVIAKNKELKSVLTHFITVVVGLALCVTPFVIRLLS